MMKKKKVLAMLCAATVTAAMMAGCQQSESSENGESSVTTEAENKVSVSENDSADQQSAASEEAQQETFIGKVMAIDESTITVQKGEITEQSGGEMPEMPGGENGGEVPEMPGGENGGDVPEMPDGEMMEMPSDFDGEMPSGDFDGEMPQMPDGETGGEMSGGGFGGEAPEMPSGDVGGEMPEMPSDFDGEMPGGDMSQMPGGDFSNMQSSGKSFEASGEITKITLKDDTKVTLEGSGEGSISDIKIGSILEISLDDDGNAEEIIIRDLSADSGVGNAGNGFGGSSEVTNGTAANTIDTDESISGERYSSDGDDENALRIDGATVALDDITVEKLGGSSSNTENGDFYGQNAGLLALNGADVTITGAEVTTDAVNGNGVFSYGENTTVHISDSTIRTTQNNSGGIQTTGGATTIAENLDIETQGNSAAAIRSDRGGGTVQVTGGSYVTNGTGSPAIYCTADITVSDAALTANHSEGVVVEGKNSVSLKDCDLVSDMENTYNGDEDENIHGIMIYQSMSGDAEVGQSHFSAEGGSITVKSGDLFYITNTSCEIILQDIDFTLANDTFMRIEGNSSSRGWGTEGANGGDVTLTTKDQTIEGNILVDSISTLQFDMGDGTAFVGAINPDGEGGSVDVTMEAGSTWTLTGDSYISSFDGDASQITANGYHVYVNGEELL
jgi:hypothetical protein